MTSEALPTLRAGNRTLRFERGRPLIMGIVNANPDSFSDSVRLDTVQRQVDHALRLVADGADLIDVGGESGVTYTGVTAAEVEAERVVPVIERLSAEGVLVSVDTWKPDVARAAVAAGATILNDVSGLRDPGLADVAAQTGCALVVMHTRAELRGDKWVINGRKQFISNGYDAKLYVVYATTKPGAGMTKGTSSPGIQAW